MLDSGGMIIPKQLIIDQPNCTDKALPWSLELYMMVHWSTRKHTLANQDSMCYDSLETAVSS